MTPRSWRPHVWALLAYACAVVVFSWPLPLHLGTHFTGSPAGDTGVTNVASLTVVALATVVIGRCAGWRIPRLWAGTGALFAALSLGPFIHVAGVNSFIPGPWALLRYVPIVGLARTPSRFSIVVMLAVAILFASALTWLGQRWPRRRQFLLLGVGALVIFEILPAPRPLYSAEIPSIYRQIAAAPGEGRVPELPFGVRDGTLSYGDFSARSQYFQARHQKPLAGGYLSRVSRRRVNDTLNIATAAALVTLSEGTSLDVSREHTLVEEGPAFVRKAGIAFVDVDRARASDQLRTFAVRAFRLRLIETDGDFELYMPPLLAD